jgi:TRAP-type transport system periplasmic protein
MKVGKFCCRPLILIMAAIVVILILSGCAAPQTTTPQSTSQPPVTKQAPPVSQAPITSGPAGSSQPAASTAGQKPIQLTLLSGFGEMDPVNTFTKPFVDLVNKKGEGGLSIRYAGGPEVMSTQDQSNALQNGVIDIDFNAITRFSGILPDTGVVQLSRISAMEERTSGYYDFIVERMKTIKILYLGRGNTPTYYYYSLNKSISKVDDLAGTKARTTATYEAFLKALKVVGVSMPDSDVYNSLQTGVIQGFILPIWTQDQMKLYEVAKFFIDYPFYTAGGTAYMMNLDSFNRLPKNYQDIILQSTIEIEKQNYDYFTAFATKSRDSVMGKGMKPIKFSDEDAKRFLDLAYDSQWEVLQKTVSADVIAKAKKLSSK